MHSVSNFIQMKRPPYWSLGACLALKTARGKRSRGTWLWRKWSLKLTVPLASGRSSGSSTKIKTLVINFFVNLLSATAVHWRLQHFEGCSPAWRGWLLALAGALHPAHYRLFFCFFSVWICRPACHTHLQLFLEFLLWNINRDALFYVYKM